MRNFFRYNHCNVADYGGKSFQLPKFFRRLSRAEKKIRVQLGHDHRAWRVRLCGRKLSAETDHSVTRVNIRRQREIGKLVGAKRQIWDNARKHAFQIEQVETVGFRRAPVGAARDVSPEQTAQMPFFFSRCGVKGSS